MEFVEKLMKHVETAKKAYVKAYTAIDQATARHTEAVKKMKTQQNELTKEAYSKKWNDEQTAYNQELSAIENTLSSEVEAAQNEYLKELYAYYQPSGSNIIDDDVKLLQSGIKLSTEEIERLVAKNADNTTMLRLLDQYKLENKVKVSREVEVAFSRAKKAGQPEQAAFVTFTQLAGNCVRMAAQGMAGSETYIKCADRLEEYVADLEMNLKKAKVYLDEYTRAELLEMEEEKKLKEHNAWLGHNETV